MTVEIISGKNIGKELGEIPKMSLDANLMKEMVKSVLMKMPCPVIAGVRTSKGIDIFLGGEFLVSLTVFMANWLPIENGATFRTLTPAEAEMFTELKIPVTVYDSLTDSEIKKIKAHFEAIN